MSASARAAIEALHERGWTVGVAESLTGGAVSSALVSVAGASSVFVGGVVAYATPIKHTLLGVDERLLEEYGPVHPQVALQMAEGVRRSLAVDGSDAAVGVSTTGIAGPESPDGQPVGTVHIGVVTPERAETQVFLFEGNRARIREQAVDAALSMLVSALRE